MWRDYQLNRTSRSRSGTTYNVLANELFEWKFVTDPTFCDVPRDPGFEEQPLKR